MKGFFKKIALCVLFAMVATMLAPVAEVAYAAKTFTYAEQYSGDKVTVLFMDPGEKVDLKFIGVPDYKNYTLKWVSSNEKVAVVDSTGMITAISKGTTTIRLNIGNGTAYTSAAVRVYVGEKQEAYIGTVSQDEIKSYVLESGSKVVLKANGIKDMVGDRYTCTWSSTDTSVAKINNEGVVTAVAPGLTVIQLKITKKHSGEVIEATPIALRVTEKGEVIPSTKPTATPTITKKPQATATPTPTPTTSPYVSPTPTPVPSDQYVPYTASLETDNCLLLRFTNKVSYDVSDVKLFRLTVAGSGVYEVSVEVIDAKLSSDGRELRVTPESRFENGERYLVRVGDADTTGTTVNVVLGAPNRLEVTYSCLGKEGVAYAYNEELPIEVPVTLEYRLYYGNIDVTETYNAGFITYDFANAKYAESASLSGNVVNFYEANKSVVLKAKYSYYDDNYKLKELNSNSIMIRSEKLPTYGITGIVDYTVIDSAATSVDWSNKTTKVIANTGNYKLVVKIADNYGNYYTNDARAVDEANKVYSIDDYNYLFSQFGYGIEFRPNDQSQIILQSDGTLYPFKETKNVIGLVALTNNGTTSNVNTRDIGACPLTVLAESRLASVAAENSRITLATTALSGYENRFCRGTVEILLKDQYGNAWNGDYNLELASSVSEINSSLSGSSSAPAWIEENILHVDAVNIKAVTKRVSFPLTITETTTNRKITVNVTLQSPTIANNQITTTGWSIGLDDSSIVIGDEAMQTLQQSASIEFFKTSSNGVKVGLYENLYVIDSGSYKFTTTNCSAGDIYVYVSGPDGKPVQLGSSSEVGVYVDHVDHCVKINVFATGSGGSGVMLESLPEGKYNVKATRIVSVGNTVSTAVLTTTFSITDETKEVSFRSIKSTKTPIGLSHSTDLESVKEIVASVLTFNLDGKEWTGLTKSMITDVEYVVNGKVIVIRSVEFAVPVSSSNAYGLSYRKTVTGINKAITTGVSY